MIQLTDMIEAIRKEGYNDLSAEARVCQDVVLKAIASSQFNKNITVKGGVLRCMEIYIFSNPEIKENNIDSIMKRIRKIFTNNNYRRRIEQSRSANWMGLSPDVAIDTVEKFLENL